MAITTLSQSLTTYCSTFMEMQSHAHLLGTCKALRNKLDTEDAWKRQVSVFYKREPMRAEVAERGHFKDLCRRLFQRSLYTRIDMHFQGMCRGIQTDHAVFERAGSICVHSLATQDIVFKISMEDEVACTQFADNTLFVGERNGKARFYNIAEKKCIATLDLGGQIKCCALQNSLALIGLKYEALLYDFQKQQTLQSIDLPDHGEPSACALHAPYALFALSLKDTTHLYDINTKTFRQLSPPPHGDNVTFCTLYKTTALVGAYSSRPRKALRALSNRAYIIPLDENNPPLRLEQAHLPYGGALDDFFALVTSNKSRDSLDPTRFTRLFRLSTQKELLTLSTPNTHRFYHLGSDRLFLADQKGVVTILDFAASEESVLAELEKELDDTEMSPATFSERLKRLDTLEKHVAPESANRIKRLKIAPSQRDKPTPPSSDNCCLS